MFPLLIIREEIVCLIILLFLLLNAHFYRMGKDSAGFVRLTVFAVGHVVFDIVTAITVNNRDALPEWLNVIFHVTFYIFAVLFAYEFFCCTAENALTKSVARRVRRLALVPGVLFVLLLPLLPIEYVTGAGTEYSSGPAVYAGYGLTMLYFVGSIVVLLCNHKKIEPHVKTALYPMLLMIIAAELIQIAVPELLFTGGVVTIISVGFFFSLENPAAVFQQKVQIDALTGVKSRHGYEDDIAAIERSYSPTGKDVYCAVFCDINRLRAVNNLYGHAEGDAYISSIAQFLQQELCNAENIYRMGGDEFLAMYKNCPESTVGKELEAVHHRCEALTEEKGYEADVAMGYAISGEQFRSIRDVLKVADYRMYQNKAEIKKQNAYTAGGGDASINVIGLTDRIFEAFASSGERSYPFVCNMETNVTRLSPLWVEQFDLSGEFVFNFDQVWAQRVHPEDREAFSESVREVLNGKAKSHVMEYRAMNGSGEYVVCTCRGSVYEGKNGEPDLFAGTLVNHGIAESIDPVTGLHNDQIFNEDVQRMLDEGEQGIVLKLSIVSFSRINMLYGYSFGNEVLCNFAAAIRRMLKKDDRIYRLDGIKFVLCLPRTDAEAAEELYRKIQYVAAHEIIMERRLVPLQIAGGALMLDGQVSLSASAIQSSLIYAHEQSKYEQQGRLVFYDRPSDDGRDPGDYRLLTLIHQDATGGHRGFYLRYQPILRMDNGHITGAEALIRWHDELCGEVEPGRFIAWLENDPCFYEIGCWILRQALSDAQTMRSLIPDFTINVNITVTQLGNEGFHDDLLAALEETGFPATQLCLELTERCRVLDVEFLNREFDFFHEHGIRVALDDVGTGTSSLSMVLKLPMDEIKLDKSLVQEVIHRSENQLYVQSISDAVDRLKRDLLMCFEGIEDQATFDYLSRYPNASYQGYFFSPPLLFEELMERAKAETESVKFQETP